MVIKGNQETIQLGKKIYIGQCTESAFERIGLDRYDTKVLHFRDGRTQIQKASKKIYRIPVPDVLPKIKRHTFTEETSPEETTEYRKTREDNLLRARARMWQIVMCNEWDWFITLTFNDKKVNASDVGAVMQKLQNWLKNLVQRNNAGYLLVPEYHKKDKRVHIHALISGEIPVEKNDIYAVQGFKKPIRMATIKKYGISEERIRYPVYNVSNWRYGYSTAISVYGSIQRLANYCLKYMTKDVQEIFGRHYWCSKNIQLYPRYELYNAYDYYRVNAREYWSRGSDVSYKYINNCGDLLKELSDDEVTI